MSRSIEVVAAVITAGSQVLACRRSLAKSAGGRWEFPGGKVEPGESHEGALLREIYEELNVTITVQGLIDRSTTHVDDIDIDLACYRATLVDSLPTGSTDHDQLRWVAVSDLRKLEWAEPDLPAVSRLTAGADSASST